MAQCCDGERSTPFCPQCGKQLTKVSPLTSLVQRCRQSQKGLLTQAERRRLRPSDNPDAIKRSERAVNGLERQAKKWGDWADQLESLLGVEP